MLHIAERCIAQTVARGEDVSLRGFGNFALQVTAPRPGRNPRTGATIAIGETRRMIFHAAPSLRAALAVHGAPAAAAE